MTNSSCVIRDTFCFPRSASRDRRSCSRPRRWSSAQEDSVHPRRCISRRQAWERSRSPTATRWTSPTCSARFFTPPNRSEGPRRRPGAVRFDGQVSVFDLRDDRSPCYHCLFPENAGLEEVRCAVMGVFAPLTGIIGAVQAAEALKLLAGAGETLKGRLLILDA